jgi:hypothetical protein
MTGGQRLQNDACGRPLRVALLGNQVPQEGWAATSRLGQGPFVSPQAAVHVPSYTHPRTQAVGQFDPRPGGMTNQVCLKLQDEVVLMGTTLVIDD